MCSSSSVSNVHANRSAGIKSNRWPVTGGWTNHSVSQCTQKPTHKRATHTHFNCHNGHFRTEAANEPTSMRRAHNRFQYERNTPVFHSDQARSSVMLLRRVTSSKCGHASRSALWCGDQRACKHALHTRTHTRTHSAYQTKT